MRNRVIIAFGVVLFLILVGTGTASALWSSVSGVGGTVSAGNMGISQTGFDSMAVEYSTDTTKRFAPVTVTNTGSVASRYRLLLRGPANNAIATSASVQTKIVKTAAECTSSTNVTTYKWTTLPELTNTLAAGASVIYCVQSSMTTSQIDATATITMDATLALTATSSVGSWTATPVSAVATQSSPDTEAPTNPALTASATTATSTTLSWSDSTDNVGVVGYDLYRNNVMVASGLGNTWTDTSLVRNTSYTYKLNARDAAGNIGSTSITVKTLYFDSSVFYTVRASQATNQCIDASGASTKDNTALILWPCSSDDNQAWKFVKVGTDTYRISAKNATASGWSIARSNNTYSDAVTLWTYSNTANNLWKITPVGTDGTMLKFVNTATSQCLDLNGRSTATNTTLRQSACTSTTTASSQNFTFAVDN
jgi:chitodextrinase